MTVEQLREYLRTIPGHTEVWIMDVWRAQGQRPLDERDLGYDVDNDMKMLDGPTFWIDVN